VSEIVNITKSVPVSKVMLVCPKCSKPTRVGYKIEGGDKMRVCKRCGEMIETEVKEEKKEAKESDSKKAKAKKSKSKKSKK